MLTLARLAGLLCGVALAVPLGLRVGCGIYEARGPDYRQCGYEFEGMGHVLAAGGILALLLGALGWWLGGLIWRRFRDSD